MSKKLDAGAELIACAQRLSQQYEHVVLCRPEGSTVLIVREPHHTWEHVCAGLRLIARYLSGLDENEKNDACKKENEPCAQ